MIDHTIDNDKSLRRLKRCVLSIPTACSSSKNSENYIYISIFIHYIILYSVYIYNIYISSPRSGGCQSASPPGRRIAGPSKCPWPWEASTGRNGDWNRNHPQMPMVYSSKANSKPPTLAIHTTNFKWKWGWSSYILGSLFKWLLLIWVGREESL